MYYCKRKEKKKQKKNNRKRNERWHAIMKLHTIVIECAQCRVPSFFRIDAARTERMMCSIWLVHLHGAATADIVRRWCANGSQTYTNIKIRIGVPTLRRQWRDHWTEFVCITIVGRRITALSLLQYPLTHSQIEYIQQLPVAFLLSVRLCECTLMRNECQKRMR